MYILEQFFCYAEIKVINFDFMKTVLITGGTGLIGKALTAALLERGYEIIILTRKLPEDKSRIPNPDLRITYALWNISDKKIDKEAITKADYTIHLAGASVAEKRWTAKRKKEIVDSRVESGKLIVESLKAIPNKVKAVISISGIGWYGEDPAIPNEHPFREDAPSDNSFLGKTCRQWEGALEPLSFSGKRLVKLRTGIVLSRDGGAFTEFIKPLKFGLATILGRGNQVISWIHIDDLVRLFVYAIETESLEGVYNAVAPEPVSNKEFILKLAKKIKGRFFIPIHVPSFVLKTVLGEVSTEVLKSATVNSSKIQEAGFIFQYPQIDKAFQQLLA